MTEDIHYIWKEKGETMGELLTRFKFDHPEFCDDPITYAGRLDPMAEGVVVLLVGEARHRKNEFLHLDKEYEFEVLWGFETDTLDMLGLVESGTPITQPPSRREGGMSMLLQTCIGKHTQRYPAYSSRKVEGKPLFQWATEGKLDEITIPEHEIEIHSLEMLSERSVLGKDLLLDIEDQISKVKGDFRQEEIIKLWRETLQPLEEKEFILSKMKAKVSSGTYVRSLIHDFGKRFGCGALTYAITRTKVGEYTVDLK